MTVTTTPAVRGTTRTALVGVVAAVAVATAIWAVASLLDVDLAVSFGGGDPIQVTVVSVVATSLVASLAGWGLLAVLRRSARGVRTWTVVAVVAALASLLGPLTATAPVATKLTLVAMHLAVAAVLVLVLRRGAKA